METITENGLHYPLLIALKKKNLSTALVKQVGPEHTFPQVLSQPQIHPTALTHKGSVHGRSGAETLPSDPMLAG